MWNNLNLLSPPVNGVRDSLFSWAPDGYTIDLPITARELMRRIVSLDWHGVLVAIDDGKSSTVLCEEYPKGTSRAYGNRRQHTELLANPGEQDLTCHVCWDWLMEELREAGFKDIRVEIQEFF